MADSDVKALTSEIECPVFEHAAFTTPKSLAESTVAIVTTASLHHADQDDFERGDTTYRVLDGSRRDLQLGHWSPNFDTSGYASDINVVFPIDRLHELAASGRIGKVADQHLSYAGNQFDLSTIRLDSGPAGAAMMKAAGVDVVILTPV
jgi:D-proline reductase (dithiol) PrdB